MKYSTIDVVFPFIVAVILFIFGTVGAVATPRPGMEFFAGLFVGVFYTLTSVMFIVACTYLVKLSKQANSQ